MAEKPEEIHWRALVDVRVPICQELSTALLERIAAIAEPRKVKLRREFFEPLPDFPPCASRTCTKEAFEFCAFY